MLRQNRELTLLILTHYLPVAFDEMKKDIPSFFKQVELVADSRGLPFVVKYVKDSRVSVMRYLSGNPLKVGDLAVLNKNGWPIWLSAFEQYTTRPEHLRVLMTLLMSLRSIKLSPVLDTSTIVTPSKSENLSDSEITTALRLLGVGPITAEWDHFHLTVKKGPVGQAILMSMTEATLLSTKLVGFINLLGGNKLASRLSDLKDSFDILPDTSAALWSKVYPAASSCLRRLSYFSDKEGKTRVIAILDYWTQSALYPLHNALNKVLRRIHCDCTFDQGKFKLLLEDKPIYFSIDLSAATDRMPITFQKKVLSYLIGEAKANA
jgi:hypothetical protein